jgi:hypothetical protein
MLKEPTTGAATVRTPERDDHSMKLVEYGLAIVAVAAALLLALIR